jgi:hypothetical protein
MMLLLTRLALLMVVLVLPACEESGVCIDVRVDPELPASVQHDL